MLARFRAVVSLVSFAITVAAGVGTAAAQDRVETWLADVRGVC